MQEEEADTEDDDEYVPPTLIMDTELDYGEIEPEASRVRSRVLNSNRESRGRGNSRIFAF